MGLIERGLVVRALSTKLDWSLANPLWAALLNPLLKNPLNSVQIIQAALATGANTLDHKLGRQMQGWFLVDIDAAVTVYRSQPMNTLTLTLTASGPVNVLIGVF